MFKTSKPVKPCRPCRPSKPSKPFRPFKTFRPFKMYIWFSASRPSLTMQAVMGERDASVPPGMPSDNELRLGRRVLELEKERAVIIVGVYSAS
jgi:hypothetical protein